MREYGKVGPQFWIGETGKRLRKAGSDAQVVALYLMTSPHANMLGLYYVPMIYMAHETGLGMEGASEGLRKCIEAGYCQYDEVTEMVWVIEMAKYQIAEALLATDKRCQGVQNEYNALPANPHLAGFFGKYSGAFNMTSKRGMDGEKESPSQAPSKPLRSQEQEQEQAHEQEQAQASGAGAATAVQISIAMRKAGVNSQPADPRLIALAAQGVSVGTVEAACAEARKSKPNEQIGVAYVAKILERWAKEAAELKAKGAQAPQKQGQWWATDATIIAKGAELGMQPLPGEAMTTFKGRIQVAIDNGGKPPAQTSKPVVTVAQSEPQRVVVDNSPEAKAARSAALQAALKKEAA